jgi:contact-dependent growth inhibition (CDI) system CdiI-like immunity protein
MHGKPPPATGVGPGLGSILETEPPRASMLGSDAGRHLPGCASMPRQPPDETKNLDELEGTEWGPPAWDSYLVTTCHRLRKKPIGQLTVEDLRILIGQKIGLRFLVPLALEVLEREPLVAGDFYEGDLLSATLSAGRDFWTREWDWAERLRRIVARLEQVPPELSDAVREFRSAEPGTE